MGKAEVGGGDGALNTAGIVWDGQGRSWGRGWRTEYSRHCVGWARQTLEGRGREQRQTIGIGKGKEEGRGRGY